MVFHNSYTITFTLYLLLRVESFYIILFSLMHQYVWCNLCLLLADVDGSSELATLMTYCCCCFCNRNMMTALCSTTRRVTNDEH